MRRKTCLKDILEEEWKGHEISLEVMIMGDFESLY